MSKFRRVCINLPVEIETELRMFHADTIAMTGKSVSFSKLLSYMLEETLTEKRKQQWYNQHNCALVEL